MNDSLFAYGKLRMLVHYLQIRYQNGKTFVMSSWIPSADVVPFLSPSWKYE